MREEGKKKRNWRGLKKPTLYNERSIEKGSSCRSKRTIDLIALTNTPVEPRRYRAGQPKKIRCHVLSSTSSPFGNRSFIAAPLPPNG